MVSVIDDAKGVERRLKQVLDPILQTDWFANDTAVRMAKDGDLIAAFLDIALDLIVDSKIGLQYELIPADEPQEWFTPRKLISSKNGNWFEVGVGPISGFDLVVNGRNSRFIERAVSIETLAMLLRCFAGIDALPKELMA